MPPAKRTILVVDDEPHIVMGLRDALEFEGFRVISAGKGRDGIGLARSESPDAIILDLMLPDVNGYAVCEELRRINALVPIIMLTARSQEADKVRGLDSGADDYVTKPFGVNELIARVRAIFRRATASVARSGAGSAETLALGEATVNLTAQTVNARGREHTLSFYEVELLRMLAERAGQPVSRDEILAKVWGLEGSSTNRTVDNFIVKLRKKIEKLPDRPAHILTVYGYGYKLVTAAAATT
jgi:DNA-binding response OmpR family regulator